MNIEIAAPSTSTRILTGDCRRVLAGLEADSVQCCVTSPPYFRLRSYLPDNHPDKGAEIGLERKIQDYIANLVAVFEEVRRVLRPDGVLWVNIADSYASGGLDTVVAEGIKPKDLCLVPARLVQALQEPRYLGRIKAEKDREWLAALIDGEGCFGIRRQQRSGDKASTWNDTFIPYLAIRMNDRAMVDRAAKITGFGVVREEGARVGTDSRGIKTRHAPFSWRLDGNGAVAVARELFPHLMIKGPQAALIAMLDDSNKGHRSSRGSVVPPEEMAVRAKIYQTVKALNQREIEGLPDWCPKPGAMFAPGWWVRKDVIWHKTRAMPESVADRPASAHEYLFMLTKSAIYFYDHEKVRTPLSPTSVARMSQDIEGQAGSTRANDGERADRPMKAPTLTGVPHGRHALGDNVPPAERWDKQRGHSRRHNGFNDRWDHMSKAEQQANGANLRDVWMGAPPQYRDAHFATMPEWMVETCLKASTRPGDLVLDPFMGAATTLLVAHRMQRNAVGVELNPAYVEMAERRLRADAGLLLDIERDAP